MGILGHLFGPQGKDKFARLALKKFRAANSRCGFSYDHENFQLRSRDEKGLIINLANVYAEYCAAPAAERHLVLANFVAGFASAVAWEMPGVFEQAQDRIMPSIRSRSFFELAKLQGRLEMPHSPVAIYDLVNEHLACGYVYDSESTMRFLTQADVADWGTAIYQIQEAARHNLEQQRPMGFAKIGSGFYSVVGDGNYGATRLTQMDFVRQMEVEGDYIAAVPNRGSLLVTGSKCDEGLQILADSLTKELEQPRPISGFLFKLQDDEWVPWLPPQGHATYARFKQAAVRQIMGDYGDQKPLLEQLHQKNGDDVFIASCSGISGGDIAGAASYCVWAKGVVSLLPKTDKIAFMEGEGLQPAIVDWEQASAIVGDLMEPQELYPVRYRVEEFPTAERLATLAKTSL